MKIAYKSAYIQLEMFNFTFAQQAIIVYCLCSNFQEIATPNATTRSLHAIPHNYATKAPLGRPKFTPETTHSPSMINNPI